MSGPPAPARTAAEEEPPLDEEDLRWFARMRPFDLLALRLRGNRTLVAGLVLLGAFVAIAVAAVVVYGPGLGLLPSDLALAESLNPPGPSPAHPFGAMNGLGVDVLAALFQATPNDLALVGGVIVTSLGLGVILGSVAGLTGGRVDGVVTFLSDLLVGVPPFFFVMVLFLGVQRFITPEVYLLVFGGLFVVVLWPAYARSTRARAVQVAQEPYVEAARASGATTGRVLARHLIPNSFFPVLAQVPVDLYNIFFVLTAFPFLNCFTAGAFYGLLSPFPSGKYPEWGFLLAQGACSGWSPLAEINHWWMYTFPALTILAFGIAVSVACDGFERYLTGARPTA